MTASVTTTSGCDSTTGGRPRSFPRRIVTFPSVLPVATTLYWEGLLRFCTYRDPGHLAATLGPDREGPPVLQR